VDNLIENYSDYNNPMHDKIADLSKKTYFRTVSMTFIMIVIVLIIIWVRAFYGSMNAYHQGETYLKENKIIKAVTFFDRAIRWYTPFNTFVSKSVARLWAIGEEAEQRSDIKLALIAFRTIRRGFYASRSIYQPGSEWIERCGARIDYLNRVVHSGKEIPVSSETKKGYTPESQKAVSPNIIWTVILEIGFLGWIVSVICFILNISRHKGEHRYPISSVIIYTGLTIVFFTVWIIGMMKA